MRVIEIVCKHWIFKHADAITIYPFIFYRFEPNETLRRHEWVHVEQVRRQGWFKFYTSYIWQWAKRVPYRERPAEIEAFNRQHNAEYTPWIDDKHREYEPFEGWNVLFYLIVGVAVAQGLIIYVYGG